MFPEVRTVKGSSHGKNKRIERLVLCIRETIDITVNEVLIDFAQASDIMGEPKPLFTGDKLVTDVSNRGWDRDRPLVMEQTQALPWTLRGAFADIEVEEES